MANEKLFNEILPEYESFTVQSLLPFGPSTTYAKVPIAEGIDMHLVKQTALALAPATVATDHFATKKGLDAAQLAASVFWSSDLIKNVSSNCQSLHMIGILGVISMKSMTDYTDIAVKQSMDTIFEFQIRSGASAAWVGEQATINKIRCGIRTTVGVEATSQVTAYWAGPAVFLPLVRSIAIPREMEGTVNISWASISFEDDFTVYGAVSTNTFGFEFWVACLEFAPGLQLIDKIRDLLRGR